MATQAEVVRRVAQCRRVLAKLRLPSLPYSERSRQLDRVMHLYANNQLETAARELDQIERGLGIEHDSAKL